MVLDALDVPIVQAPMAGGPSTPALAAAVCGAGGLGVVAAGYRTAEALAAEIAAVRAATDRPFGVNVFLPSGAPAEPAALAPYLDRLRAAEHGELGAPRFDDDGFDAKLELLVADPVAVVSCTFGCPTREVVDALHAAGSEVWVTVTGAEEAVQAAGAGADVLVAQGVEAGGHRASFADDDAPGRDLGLLALVQVLRAAVDVPLVATGGIATGAAVAAVLVAGARAAQLGSAFLLCPEAGTSAPQRAAVARPAPTGLTRAFSGRLARGIVNRFQREHTAAAPSAYPELHHVTAPLRAAAREAGDAETINLWAGQAHHLAEERPAAEVVARLARDARAALDAPHPI